MIQFARIFSLIAAFSFSSAVLAHGDHNLDTSTVSMVEAKGIAGQEVDRLIKAGKLDEAWAGQPLSAAMERVNNQRQWVLTTTANIADTEQKLMLFLSTEGYFLSYDVKEL